MDKQKILQFINNPIVAQAVKEGEIDEVIRMASMAGSLSKDPDLRKFARELGDNPKLLHSVLKLKK